MIVFSNVGPANPNTSYGWYLRLYGDGISSSITIDLSDAPFQGVQLRTNPPVTAYIVSSNVVVSGISDSSFSAASSIVGNRLTLTYNKPLPLAVGLDASNSADVG